MRRRRAVSSSHVRRLAGVTGVIGVILFVRSADETAEEKGQTATGRETAPDGVQRRSAGPAEEGVYGEPVPDRATETGAGQRARSERGPDQNMVSEQTGENQEGQRHQESIGPAADGAGTVQPQHGHGY